MKYALIIGNNKYDDQKLAQLKTPAADSQALAKILDDKTIGSFDEVTPLINQTETRVRRALSTFLTNKKPDDLVLLYFSGHGVLDDRGRLYLALKDTQVNLLKATSISSSFVADEMDSCRSRRQILILDCCHSGAFARGTKGEQKAITETTFEGSGFGRVVLTASDSTQYALEGDQVIKQTELSLFTHFLLQGLQTGAADINNDGLIALDEWYDYTYNQVVSETPRQVPHKWSYNQQGDLVIAKNPFVKKKVVELPSELLQALESSFVGIRESAVNELGRYLQSRDPEMVELAISSLKKMKEDDSRRISLLAEGLLSKFEQEYAPIEVAAIKPSDDIELEMASDSSTASPKMNAEIEPLSSAATSPAKIEKESVLLQPLSVPETHGRNLLFWFKWIAIVVLGYVILTPLTVPFYENNIIHFIPLLFATLIAPLAVAQWLGFRNQLENWWIPANMAGGIFLGGLVYLINQYTDWWGRDILFRLLVLANIVLGTILLRRMQKKPAEYSSKPVPEFIEAHSRQNIFIMLLSIFLVLFGFFDITSGLNNSGITNISSSLRDTAWTLLGIMSILAGVSFFLIKGVPRNFGFITLAIFLILNGFIIELFAYDSGFSPYFFQIPGTLSLLPTVFFVSQRETRKYLRYIMLSGYLIFLGLVYFGADNVYSTSIFSIIATIFALLAAVFFFLRK
jgi:caspase domain-containing protein